MKVSEYAEKYIDSHMKSYGDGNAIVVAEYNWTDKHADVVIAGDIVNAIGVLACALQRISDATETDKEDVLEDFIKAFRAVSETYENVVIESEAIGGDEYGKAHDQ